MSLRIGAYTRVSTDEQANVIEGSLDNQRHRMKSFVDLKNLQESAWGNIIEFYIEDGFSAKDTNRPAYQRMMKDLKKGKIDAVMVTELSRLSRNIPDFCDFHKLLEFHSAKFFSIKEQFDTSTPAGKMMLYNMVNLAQFEREQTAERVSINFHARAKRGLLNGGPAILGYDKDPSQKTTFIVNKKEARAVVTIFDLFLENRTLGRTIDALETNGIKSKSRKNKKYRLIEQGRWTTDSLGFLLRNRAYIGEREVNKENQHQDQKKLKSWQQYSLVKASWPPIVEKKTFDAVQEILQNNRDKERMRLATSASRVFAASNICICEECGRKLVGQSAHGRRQAYRYYVHTSKRGDVINCAIKRIKADKIEEKIASYLTDILLDAEHFEKIESRIRDSVAFSPEELKSEKDRISSELKKVSLAVKNTFKIQSELDAHSDAIRETAKELEILSRQKRVLESELENLKVRESNHEDVEDAVLDLKNKISAFNKGWIKASAPIKKALLQDILHAVIIGPKGFKIQYKLKHNLNKPVSLNPTQEPSESTGNVVKIAKHRRPSSKGTAAGSDFHNLSIKNLQVEGFGRGCKT